MIKKLKRIAVGSLIGVLTASTALLYISYTTATINQLKADRLSLHHDVTAKTAEIATLHEKQKRYIADIAVITNSYNESKATVDDLRDKFDKVRVGSTIEQVMVANDEKSKRYIRVFNNASKEILLDFNRIADELEALKNEELSE